MFNLIDPIFFLVSFAIGIIYLKVTADKPKIVYKYPTPHNAGKITYVDDAGVCYKYNAIPVTCPPNNVQKYFDVGAESKAK